MAAKPPEKKRATGSGKKTKEEELPVAEVLDLQLRFIASDQSRCLVIIVIHEKPSVASAFLFEVRRNS